MSLFIKSIYTATAFSAFYVAVLYFSDRYKKESFASVTLAFFAGIFAAVTVSLLHILLPWVFQSGLSETYPAALFSHFVQAGLAEEVVKLAFFWLVVWQYPFEDFPEPYDGMVYLGILGAGFAVYEDFTYIFGHAYPPWESGDMTRFREAFRYIIIQRSFPGHIIFGALSGYFLGQAKFTDDRFRIYRLVVYGTGLAIIAHGTFNLIGVTGGGGWLTLYIIGWLGILLHLRQRLLEKSPFEQLQKMQSHSRLAGNWKMLVEWDYSRPPRDYYQLLESNQGTSIGLFPFTLSLVLVYPVLFAGIFYLHRSLAKLLEFVIPF